MSATKQKLLLSVSASLLVLAGAWLVLRARAGHGLRLIDNTAVSELLVLERSLEPRGLEPIDPGVDTQGRLARIPLDEAAVNQLFPLTAGFMYDPYVYFRYKPHLAEEYEMAEHPRGRWVRRTNAQGLREDHDLPAQRPDVFVLVAGDSHAEGVCDNAESFANRLEARLAQDDPGRSIEVLNAGTAIYSFYNYLGTLEKYADWKPDVFVTAYFGGNDFVEAVHLRHYFLGTTGPAQPRDYWAQLRALQDVGNEALAQGLNSMLYFRRFPDQIDQALQAAIDVSVEIERKCRELGIPWIAVYIPSAFDGPQPEAKKRLARARRLVDLSDADVAVHNRLADRLLAVLRARGVAVIDMRDHFEAEGGPWYWSELHIDLKAQQRIAELLYPLVATELRGQAAKLRGENGKR
jgi:lysophospholipase L1-like esterase